MIKLTKIGLARINCDGEEIIRQSEIEVISNIKERHYSRHLVEKNELITALLPSRRPLRWAVAATRGRHIYNISRNICILALFLRYRVPCYMFNLIALLRYYF